jgi:outer membrane protein, heavy metal efflux system
MMSNIRTKLFAIVIGVISFQGVTAQTFTLDSVLTVINNQNPLLKQYEFRARALDTYSKGATSWMAPMVGAGTFMTPYPNQMLMEESDKGSLMFSLEQEIPNPAKLRANRQYMNSRSAAENEARDVQFNLLRAEARTIYFSWVVAEEKLRVLDENKRIIDLMLKLARIRYPYNQGSLGSIYKAEARLHEVENMTLMTNGSIDDYALRLKSMMNLPASAKIEIDTSAMISFDPNRLSMDTVSLVERRSDIQQMNRTIETMQLNQKLQRVQARPDFRIRFDHMQPLGNMPTQFTAMAMVSIPFAPWADKMYKAEVKGMQYDIQAMREARQGMLVETRGMMAGMAVQLSRMKQQLDNYKAKIIPALQKNYRTLMLAYEENREQLPIVIDAWEALNMAQMDYLEKLEDYYNMIVSYEKELEK